MYENIQTFIFLATSEYCISALILRKVLLQTFAFLTLFHTFVSEIILKIATFSRRLVTLKRKKF